MQSLKMQMKTTVSNNPVPAALYCFFPSLTRDCWSQTGQGHLQESPLPCQVKVMPATKVESDIKIGAEGIQGKQSTF